MTYKDETYQGIVDIELRLMVVEAELKALKAQQKYLREKRASIVDLNTIDITINIADSYRVSLENILKETIERFEEVVKELNDIESQIFVLKYVKGKDNQEIMSEVALSESQFYFYLKRINNRINNSEYTSQIQNILHE